MVLNSLVEPGENLEWFDSEDLAENASVTDAKGHPVRLTVQKLRVLVFER
jgi:hypothetical protein